MTLARIVGKRGVWLTVAATLLLGASKCGEPEGGEKILLLPEGYFALREGETIRPIDQSVEARYAATFNSSPESVQCPLYRSIVTGAGKEFFLGIVLDTALHQALFSSAERERGRIDTLSTDSTTYVWYRYVRDSVRATACIYLHGGRVAYILGSTDLDGSSIFTIDSLRSRFVLSR